MLHVCHTSTGKMTAHSYCMQYGNADSGGGFMAAVARCIVLGIIIVSAASCAKALHTPTMPTGFGNVTGYLDTCAGMVFPNTPPYSAGAVSAYPGSSQSGTAMHGSGSMIPSGMAVAKASVSPSHPFRFTLRKGTYVLVGAYAFPGSNARPLTTVHVTPGTVQHINIPDECK